MNRRCFASVICAGVLALVLNLIVCGFAIAANAQTPTTVDQAIVWDRYKLKDGEFSVLLPTVPSMSSYHKEMFNTTRSPLRHLIGSYADGVAYAIYVFERQQSLDDFIKEYRPVGTMTFQRELNVNGVRGKEFQFRNAAVLRRTDYFATGHQIYIFDGEGSFLGTPEKSIAKFLDSIKFDESTDAQAIVDGAGTHWIPATPNAPGTTEAQIFSGKMVSTKVIVITKPEPTYTDSARMAGVTGTVVLRCVFRSSGTVTDLHVVSSPDNGLMEKSIAAARQIKFIPAIKDGHFVSMWMELQYNFNLY